VDNPSWEGMNGMEWKPRKPLSHRLINLTKKSHPPPWFIMMIQEGKKKNVKMSTRKNNSSLPFPSLPPRVFDYYLFCMEPGNLFH